MCPQYKGGWSCFKIHFFIESGLEMIEFKIQFKTKSGIFIQKNIHLIESRIGQNMAKKGPTNDPCMISDEFERFGINHFWQGQTKT